jgi:hypothetical protein
MFLQFIFSFYKYAEKEEGSRRLCFGARQLAAAFPELLNMGIKLRRHWAEMSALCLETQCRRNQYRGQSNKIEHPKKNAGCG